MPIEWFQTIADVISGNAKAYGPRIALASAGRTTTFAAFHDRVAALSEYLLTHGVDGGARVLILSRNRIEYLEAVCVSAFGLISVPVNWRLSPGEIGYIIEDSKPDAIIADAEFSEVVDGLLQDAKRPLMICFDGERADWRCYADIVAQPSRSTCKTLPSAEDTACIVYTSGTTGAPKGVELSHRGLMANCRAAIRGVLQLTDRDVTLAMMPFFHVGGLWYHLFPSFAAGCETHVLRDFEPNVVLSEIARHRVTNIHVVPTMLHGLTAARGLSQMDISSLRIIFYAASSIPLNVLREAIAAFPESAFVQGYGSTEGGMVSCLTPAAHLRAVSDPTFELKLTSCGRPLPGVEVELSSDGAGEILVRSEGTMARYWRKQEATEAALRDGWLRTGDLGHIDQDGYLYISDRKSDLIITGGENVFPREVEDVLERHPDIAEVAVFDLPDEKWVQRVVAAVVPHPNHICVGSDVIAFARARLAHYKCPREIFIVRELPRNGAGKVLRKSLRTAFGQSTAREARENSDG